MICWVAAPARPPPLPPAAHLVCPSLAQLPADLPEQPPFEVSWHPVISLVLFAEDLDAASIRDAVAARDVAKVLSAR